MFRLALHWQILIALVLGAGIGISVNALGGHARMVERLEFPASSLQLYGMDGPATVSAGSVWIEDSPNQILMEIDSEGTGDEPLVRKRIVVRGPAKNPREDWPEDLPPSIDDSAAMKRLEVSSLRELKTQDPAAFALFQMHGRSTARWLGDLSQMIGDLFLRLLKMVSIPLIVTSLLTGITGLGRADQLGRMFGRTILYYLSTTAMAIVIGLLAVNIIQPGHRGANATLSSAPASADPRAPALESKGLGVVLFEQVESMIPTNPFAALVEGNFLSIISFTLAFGICTLLVGGETATTIAQLANAAFAVMMKLTEAVICLAPLGVLFLMLSATAGQGLAVFGTLGWYMLTVTIGLVIHGTIVLPLIVKFVGKRSPWEFAKAISPALFMAFSSASSNGTLPLTMTCTEERAGISNRVTSFVLPLGATINMDGTALYEVVAVLFIAQMTPGIDLSFGQQVIVAFTALLASVGAAGIPHAGLVMMVIVLQAVGLPTEAQGMILAVDRVLDMARTSINVWSDTCGCAVVARFETAVEPVAG
jgi:Na+/H+-dicarboxylate symporter